MPSWRQTGLAALTERITPQNSHDAVKAIAVVWLSVTLLNGVTLYFFDPAPGASVIVFLVSAIPCYFLYRRASRAIAVLLAAYAVLSAVNVFYTSYSAAARVAVGTIAIAVAWLSWRALVATFVFQRARKARIRWLRVVLIPLGAVIGATFVPFVFALSKHRLDRLFSGETARILPAAILVFGFTLAFAALTHYWPLAMTRKNEAIAQIFA